MTNLFKTILDRFPKRKRVRGETAAHAEGAYEGFRSVLKSSLDDHFPENAAIAIALKTSGIANVNEVMERLGPSDIDRIVERVQDGSETLPLLTRQAQYAVHETTRDLLARILRGELDNPDRTPRSVASLIEKLSQRDLQAFLKLRQVVWFSETPERRAEIYCMEGSNGYSGLLNRTELERLDELGLVGFGPVPYQSHFRGPIAQKIVSFGDKKLRILNTKPDAVLEMGHWNLTSDGRFLINLYRDDEVELLEGHYEFNMAEWQKQGFNVTESVVVG